MSITSSTTQSTTSAGSEQTAIPQTGIVETMTPGGFKVLHEESHTVPLVDIAILWRTGSVLDPAGQEGAMQIMAQLLRRGTSSMTPAEVDETIASLGARLSIAPGREGLRIHGTVLARNVEPFVALIASLLLQPAFRDEDLQRVKRRVIAALEDRRDNDGYLASLHLRAFLFGEHTYARPSSGTEESVGTITEDTVRSLHAASLAQDAFLFGAAGAISSDALHRVLDAHFSAIPTTTSASISVPKTSLAVGRRVRIVDRKDRAETQLAIATLGTQRGDPDLPALVIGDNAFGGSFTSRLMQAVRADRGWSYSAQSSFSLGQERGSWAMWTHPSAENAQPCAALQLELLDRWVSDGLSEDEVERTKRFLIGSRCLDTDTPSRRLELSLDAVFHGRAANFPLGFVDRIAAVDQAGVTAAVQKCIDPSRLAIVAVGDAKVLAPAFEKLDNIAEVTVVQP